MDQSLLTEAIHAAIGQTTLARQVAVTPELVRRMRDTLADGASLPESAVVPPCVLALLESDGMLPTLPGLPPDSLVTGDEWEWHRALRLGETLHVATRLADARERFGGRLGHSLSLHHEWTFTAADGEPVAVARRSIAYYHGAAMRPADAAANAGYPPATTPDGAPGAVELPPLPQGADPRVAVEGDPITARVHTPTLGQVVRYCGAAWTFVPIFYDRTAAHAAGLPDSIIPAPLKLSLLSETVRAWLGPYGTLRMIRAAHRRPDTPGRTLRLCGQVMGVHAADGGRQLSLELWIENDQGVRSTMGAAVVTT